MNFTKIDGRVQWKTSERRVLPCTREASGPSDTSYRVAKRSSDRSSARGPCPQVPQWHPLTFVCRETDEKALSKYESYPGYHIENTGKAWNIYIKGQDVSKGEHRRPNYFYYCVPWYLSGKVLPLLPDYAGLIVLTENGKLKEVKQVLALHQHKYTNEELKLCDKFYYAYRNWKENMERHQPTAEIKRLKDEIAFLKAEYKAVSGCDIKDAF